MNETLYPVKTGPIYEKIARYYDLIHAELTADIGFVLTLAARAAGSLLELGCGSGRLLVPLARAGYTVTGIDSSPAMLSLARERLAAEPEPVQQRITLLEADMTAFELKEQFALAFVSYNTFMHLSPAQKRATLGHTRRHMQPGARLFIDLINPLAVAQTPDDRLLTLERILAEPVTGDLLVQSASSRVDLDEQVLHISWLYDTSPAAGGPVQRTVVQARYHYLYPHELELLLEESGYRLEALYGSYNLAPFGEESDRLLALAGVV
jgi:SAM-dependent methyltransferase